ncbi:MAG: LysR family transcriptional regulator [Cyanobacteria bacterium]|nr:LysR family transcriptional regulator [Cyanobacteria bacterium CG_2015-16_32_12]NCO79444.1 LysR family transcriptional regulator [Cyanobacteria bacterium CG_2015-22_32_23]NCQ03956.1 LysR family transcriptional regulator [Cyanobacteria bacterium CG_2015-09_32_10]NCQ41457.1 LysR family transcriptional regulator [Cyanobacteria bacterium CG_2015-04_32_10]NCS84285.1 LysR family transcriptional regulator [Cyanobacteria bacterium CG_2015-02_32_10]
MELKPLRYFITVAEELNFSRASVKMYVSQPALSRQIKSLEQELDVVLFLRESDGLKLTPAGVFFLNQAKDILHRTETAIKTTQTLYSKSEKPVIIAYIPTILQGFLGSLLHDFGHNYPQILITLKELSPSDQVEALRNNKIDIAFMGNPPEQLEEEFIIKTVKEVLIRAVLPEKHPLANNTSIDLAQLTSEKFIGMSEDTFPGRNDRIIDTCRCANFEPNLHLFADSHASMIALVGAKQGVAVMPSEAESLPHPQVIFMPLHNPKYYARSTAVYRKETPDKSLAKFLAILLKTKKIENICSI